MSEQKGTYTYLLRVGVGIALALVGVVGTGLGILAVVDPVGTKMADDSDPFGTPPAFAESAGITLLFLFVAGLGVCLAARRRGRLNDTRSLTRTVLTCGPLRRVTASSQ